MKVNIKKYPRWVGPYQLTNFLVKLGMKESTQEKLVDFLDKIGVTSLCNKVQAYYSERRVNVKIHYYDSWDAYVTLGHIILPVLKQLAQTKHGSPYVDDADVPDELKSTSAPPKKDEYDIDDNHHKRWEWILDEIIWAFEQLHTDWEDQYWKVKPKLDLSHRSEDEGKEVIPVRWEVEGVCDWDGMKMHKERMERGFLFFGKYYQCLWD
jgi:hypothetical protein